MKQNRRGKKLIGTPLQKKLLILVFASAVIPAGIVTVCLYFLIFNLLAWQMGIPESIAYNLIPVARKVSLIIIITLPIILFIIWIIALELSHRIVGPLRRIEKELDDRIKGKKDEPIQIRKKDAFKPLVDKINKLLNK